MRFMVIMYPGAKAEAEAGPTDQLTNDEVAAMGKFNEELVAAGVILAGEGLQPTRKGARVRFQGGKPTVSHGPFTDAKEIVGGFWLWQVASKEEAIQWAQRCPCGDDAFVELRQVYEMEDFAQDYGDAFTPEMQASETRMREQVAAQHK